MTLELGTLELPETLGASLPRTGFFLEIPFNSNEFEGTGGSQKRN